MQDKSLCIWNQNTDAMRPFDYLFICDLMSFFMRFYAYPKLKSFKDGFTLFNICIILWRIKYFSSFAAVKLAKKKWGQSFETRWLPSLFLPILLQRKMKSTLDWISVKIQIMGMKVCLRCKGKTLLGVLFLSFSQKGEKKMVKIG